MPCLNILRYDERRREAGGELRILMSILESEKGCIIYHNTGLILGSLEDYVIGLIPLMDSDKNFAYLHACLWDAIGDLKSSLWLAFTGRFRGAMISLRSALELSVFGVNLSFKAKEYDEEKLEEYINYQLGIIEELHEDLKRKFQYRFSGMLCELESRGYLPSDIKERCSRLYKELSKYVHTFKGGESYRAMFKDIESVARPSSASISMEELWDWYGYFGRVSIAICSVTLRYLAKNRLELPERSQNAIGLLSELFEKGPQDSPLPWVDCPFLREL